MSFPTPEAFSSTAYDFVIVGGGTTGLVLATRLTEDPNVTVGVIEAGGYISDMPEVIIPGMAGKGLNNPRLDWMFKTTPQVGANGRCIVSPRGKGLGGSSALNFLVYSRASSAEYDAIEALGNPGWNWAEFLKYMKKVETFTGPPAEITERYHAGAKPEVHGTNGPLKISFSHWYNELHVEFMDAIVNLGVPINIDACNGDNVGASTGLFSIDPELATRTTAATAYYQPNANRKTLVVLPEAHVTRVLLEPSSDGEFVATGVEFVKDGRNYSVRAKREVLLAAGTFQTPQVLELSGIGLSDVLNKHDIKQLIELPVGENFQDHGWVPFVHEVSKNIETYDNCRDPAFLDQQVKLYQEQRRGMLSGSFSGYAYIPLSKMMTPDVFSKFTKDVANDTTLTDSPGTQKQFSLLKEWFADDKHAQLEILQFPTFYSLGPLQRKDDESARYQTLLIIDLHPLSRGSIHICSSDPLAAPAIDSGYLKNPRDLDVLVNGVRFARKLTQTAPYNKSQPTLYDPPAEVIDDDEQLKEWCRNRVEPIYHPVGTCSMLPKADGGVVDPNLRVYGTKNLRVVDASIIPLELSSHIQSTVYAVAEKAAVIIKSSYA